MIDKKFHCIDSMIRDSGTDEYEKYLREQLRDMEVAHREATEPILRQLCRIAAMRPMPQMVIDASKIDLAVLAKILAQS